MVRTVLAAAAAAAILAGSTVPTASATSCYYKNCTEAHKAGEGDIKQGTPHYCAPQDRDNDGVACEW
ncbi:MAG: hypothetical protein QOH60_2711 [Mycobacterium sp.]|jgi:hypothetical protein|nr:hypothetical protein [Mycobacterium sp.]